MIKLDDNTARLLTSEIDKMDHRLVRVTTSGPDVILFFEWVENVDVDGLLGGVLFIAEMLPAQAFPVNTG